MGGWGDILIKAGTNEDFVRFKLYFNMKSLMRAAVKLGMNKD